MTPFQVLCKKWEKGCGSEHCERARRVFWRGRIPCDVAFVGEAPGESENVLGQPFIGEAGKLLDRIIERSCRTLLCPVCGRAQQNTPSGTTCANGHGGEDGRPVRIGLTNVVGCIPRTGDGGKAGEPDDDQVVACAPRLQEFLALARPRLVVAVGKVAEGWLMPGFKHSIKLYKPVVYTTPSPIPDGWYQSNIRLITVTHPAAIMRGPVQARDMIIQRCVVTIANAIEDL